MKLRPDKNVTNEVADTTKLVTEIATWNDVFPCLNRDSYDLILLIAASLSEEELLKFRETFRQLRNTMDQNMGRLYSIGGVIQAAIAMVQKSRSAQTPSEMPPDTESTKDAVGNALQ